MLQCLEHGRGPVVVSCIRSLYERANGYQL